MRTVIFDLDGTLADTSRDLIAAANASLGQVGLGAPLDPVADALTAFHGGRAMLRLGLDRVRPGWTEADVDERFAPFIDFYAAHIDRETTLYPGVTTAAERLLEAGFRLGVCTNKPEQLAETLLARLGVRDLFGSLVGADTLPVRKPDPAPFRAAVERAGGDVRRSVLVGDTDTDRRTARAAGVPCVLVTFGPEGRGVSRLDPEALLEDYDDLPGLVTALLPS